MFQYQLSVIIPCYNEGKTIVKTLQAVSEALNQLNILFEIIIVNDGSTDDTSTQIKSFIGGESIRELVHDKNKGKGACIHSALKVASGKSMIIQDADLEYDPRDIGKLLPLILEDKADVVYGSRFMGSDPHRVLFYFHTIGNKFLTALSNIFTGLNLTDMETGYKLFRMDIVKNIPLKEKRFGFEPEITAKISRIKNIRIYEVGIGYYGRTYADGKKITWQDGFKAIYCILKYNLISKK